MKTLPEFPTMLRKMWSGEEVQNWIDSNLAPLLPSGTIADSSLREALDRMDALLNPALGLLAIPPGSATAKASERDMTLIRAALSQPTTGVAEADVRLEVEHVLHTLDGGYAMEMGGDRIVAVVMALIRRAVAAQTSASTWTNERCAHEVCDEEDEHDPQCKAWSNSAPQDGHAALNNAAPKLDLSGMTVEAADDEPNGVFACFPDDEDDTRLDLLMDELDSIPGMPAYQTADFDGVGIIMQFETDDEARRAIEALESAVQACAARQPRGEAPQVPNKNGHRVARDGSEISNG